METKKYVNGVRIIHYAPTPLEKLQNIGVAIETRKRIKKELDKQLVDRKKLQKARNRLMKVLEEFALYN